MSRFVIPALALLTCGCAHYAPRPLVNNPSVLASPVAGVLQTQADKISRPWLAPVQVDLSAPLTPLGVSALAVVNNPDLAALRARADIADAQAFAAGLLPDPSFNFGVSKVLSGPDTMLNLSSALGLDLGALRKRAVTRQQAKAQARQVRLDLAWAEWQIAGQARIQAVRVLGQEQIVALMRETAKATSEQFDRSTHAALRGDISASDVEASRLAFFDAADRARAAERELLAARQELARLLGFPPDIAIPLAPDSLPELPPPSDKLFTIAQEHRADLAALRAGYDAQEASVHKAVLDQFPTLNLTISPARDSAGNFSLGPTVDFTLPIWNRNRGGIAVERATREALRREYDARLFQTRSELAAAWAGIALARHQLTEAQAGLPSLQRQAEAARHAELRGDLSRATAMTAAQQLRDRLLVIAQAGLAIREQTIALELLSGEPIEGWK